MKTLIMALSFVVSAQAHALIDIDHDEDDCVNGWISMDITVSIDGESFKFDPSCHFSFDDSFKTTSGLKCEIEAGMCSSFSPQEKLEVSCDNGSSESVDIKCPSEI